MVLHFLLTHGVDIKDHTAVTDCIKQNRLLAASLHSMRQRLLTSYGAEAAAAPWEAHVAACGGLSSLCKDSSSSSRDAALARRLRQRHAGGNMSDSDSVGWQDWGTDASTKVAGSSINDSDSAAAIRAKLERTCTRVLVAKGCLCTRCVGH
jgi:hypothetical protein